MLFIQNTNIDTKQASSYDLDEQNINEIAVFKFIQKQFEEDTCFIFHKFKAGIDKEVISHFCERLNNKLVSGDITEAEAEDKLKAVAELVLLNWQTIEVEASGVAFSEKINIFEVHLNNKCYQHNFFIVSLGLSSILHIDMPSSRPGNSINQISHIKKYLEVLHVPNAKLPKVWNSIGFVVKPDQYQDPIS